MIFVSVSGGSIITWKGTVVCLLQLFAEREFNTQYYQVNKYEVMYQNEIHRFDGVTILKRKESKFVKT